MTAETLKEALLAQLDEEKNVINMSGASEAICGLEKMSLTKEALESTRLGMLVNLVRKQNASRYPDLSRRCKNLIREWQKLVYPEGNGSTGGTFGSSPAGFSSGLTPRLNPLTPAGLISRFGGATPSPSSSSQGRVVTPVQKPSGVALPLHKSATTVDLSATQPTPSLRMKIKVGGPHPMVTTVSYPSPSLPIQQNGTGHSGPDAEGKSSRKRKLAADDSNDLHHGAPVAKKLLNGATLHKSCSTDVLLELDQQREKKQPAGGSVGSTSLHGSDPELDPSIYVVPGRLPKVKTTLEIVAGLTTADVAYGAKDQLSETPVVLGCADDYHATLEDLKDSRHKQRGRRKRSDEMQISSALLVETTNGNGPAVSPAISLIPEFSHEPLAQVKSDLVQRFLDTSVSPQALTPTSQHSGSPLDETRLEAIRTESEAEVGLTAQIGQTLPSSAAVKTEVVRPELKEKPRKKARQLHDWYAILPPLVEEKLAADETVLEDLKSTTSTVATNLQVERCLAGDWEGVSGTYAGDNHFHDWRERFLLSSTLQSLPYTDVGLPDFVQFHLPTDQRQVVGPNFFHADRLRDDSPP